MATELRKTGISLVGDMPWGTHFCHFYATKEDLLDILIPYFKMGLENNEFCMWVVFEPLTVEEATNALRVAVPALDSHLAAGHIEIVRHSEWYLKAGTFDLPRVITDWRGKLTQTLDKGYDGMRVNGNELWLTRQSWDDFSAYEEKLNQLIDNQRMFVLCTYPLAMSTAEELFDVARTHHFATAKRNGQWEGLETPDLRLTKAELKTLNAELEQRVIDRTRELDATNAALHSEITERQQTEEQLRYQATLLANVSDAIISIDLEFTIKSWNKAAEVLYGWSAREAIGKSIGELLPTEYIDGRPEDVIKQIQQAGQWQGEVIQQGKDGTKRHILSTVTRFHHAAGNMSGAVALSRDITEQVRVTKALQVSQQLTEATLNSLSAHICVLDETGIIVATNDLWRIFAQANSAIMEKVSEGVNYVQVCEATQGEARPAALAFAAGLRAVTQRQRDYFEYEYPCHSPQEQRWFMARVTPLVGSPINQRRVVVAHENITAFKQLEAQFYHAQKMESIGQLAGGIAHDFNNLLVPIIGYAELSMLKVTLDSQLYTALKRIKEAGERAARLTQQILAFSRQQVLEMKTLDLNLLIREFAPMLRSLIGENIDLQLHLAASLTALKADKGQIEQVLMNLVVNARDAMPDGGKLMIETAYVLLDKADAAKHTGITPGPYLLLTVSDTGQGMDAAIQQRIFEPFFTTKASGQGTGLGLSTVFGIVKQHQGSIWVDSQLGRGTTFKTYLPLTIEPGSGPQPPQLPADLLAGTETVLLVEDESSVRQLVGDTLRAHGYHVLEAGEPQTALVLAAAHADRIHLLLTDVVMPHMNGRKLYQHLAAVQSGLKVLYMSGYINNAITHDQDGFKETAFLQKPFTIHNLLQKVRSVLGEKL